MAEAREQQRRLAAALYNDMRSSLPHVIIAMQEADG